MTPFIPAASFAVPILHSLAMTTTMVAPLLASLLATTAALVVRTDMHPALVSLLTYAVMHNPRSGFDKVGDPVLFHRAGEFPTVNDPEFEVANEARPIYKTGELPLLLRHLAPNLRPLLLAQFWISVPVFILAEANLGILGLGVSEPLPSWGSLLRELEGLTAISGKPWMFVPLLLLIASVTAFQVLLVDQEMPS